MKKTQCRLFLALTLVSGLVAAQTDAYCDIEPDQLGAVYTMETSTGAGEIEQHRMILWRMDNRSAQEVPDQGMVDLWERGAAGRWRLVRQFDVAQRAIEYQPEEAEPASIAPDWRGKEQFLPTGHESLATVTEAGGAACQRFTQYDWEDSGRRYQLVYLEAVELPQLYRVESSEGTESWRLVELIEDPSQVQQSFARRDAYQTTDYADIGDGESDPFLSKMIRQGFTSSHDHVPAEFLR